MYKWIFSSICLLFVSTASAVPTVSINQGTETTTRLTYTISGSTTQAISVTCSQASVNRGTVNSFSFSVLLNIGVNTITVTAGDGTSTTTDALVITRQDSIDPNTDKRVEFSDFTYKGAFRVPIGNLGLAGYVSSTMASGGGGLTYNPANNSLFIVGHPADQYVVELSIPEPLIRTDISNLNTASVIQNALDVTQGRYLYLTDAQDIPEVNGAAIGGFILHNGKLYGSCYAYYDGSMSASRSHFIASPEWTQSSPFYEGMYKVGVSPNPITKANGGYVGGYMCHVPPEWQSRIGYPALTGIGALAVMARTSFGPCAWGFDPETVGSNDPNPAPASWLTGYITDEITFKHLTLGDYGYTQSLYFTAGTMVRGIAFPEETDTIMFFGHTGHGATGRGDACYGFATDDPDKHLVYADGAVLPHCWDPRIPGKGSHSFPYESQIWAYDAHEFEKAKNGEKKPWDVIPYARWTLEMPFETGRNRIISSTFDPTSNTLYIAQEEADTKASIFSKYPLIHVYQLKTGNQHPSLSFNGDMPSVSTTPYVIITGSTSPNSLTNSPIVKLECPNQKISGVSNWSFSTKLYRANNLYTVTATDAAGETVSRTIRIDYNPPTDGPELEVTKKVYITEEDTVTVTGTTSGAISIDIPGLSVSGLENWSTTVNAETASRKFYTKATDAKGNISYEQFDVVRLRRVDISQTDHFTTDSSITISGTSTNVTSITCSPSAINLGTVSSFIFELPLDIGANTITVMASDGTKTYTDSLVVTRQPPPVLHISPTPCLM